MADLYEIYASLSGSTQSEFLCRALDELPIYDETEDLNAPKNAAQDSKELDVTDNVEHVS